MGTQWMNPTEVNTKCFLYNNIDSFPYSDFYDKTVNKNSS